MRAELVESWGNDLTVVNAARVSFDNESKWEDGEEFTVIRGCCNSPFTINHRVLSERDTKLIHYLAKHKHTSCFEHQGATFRLKVPIFIARQIQRHRTFSYNEVSRRYVDTPPEFFFPAAWRKRADNVKQGSSDDEVKEMLFTNNVESWTEEVGNFYACHIEACEQLYNSMLGAGIAPEQARMILPQSMYTEFYMTGNLRNWAHFLKLRLDGHAQLEVRQIAGPIANLLAEKFPVSMEALIKYD